MLSSCGTPGRRQPFDRRHRGAIDLGGEHEARAHRPYTRTVHVPQTPCLATHVRAGQAELVAQEVREEEPNRHRATKRLAVDRELDLERLDGRADGLHAAASASARETSVPTTRLRYAVSACALPARSTCTYPGPQGAGRLRAAM
jgi:hypothetical protein